MPLDRSLYKEPPVHADSDNTEPCPPPCSFSSVVSGSSSCGFLSVDVVVAVGVGVVAGKEVTDPAIGSNILNEVTASSEGEVSGIEMKEEVRGGSCRLRSAMEEDDACCRVDASGPGDDNRGVEDRETRELVEEDNDKEETCIGVVAEAEGEGQENEGEEREKASLEFVLAEGIIRVDRNGSVSCANPSSGVKSLLSNCPSELYRVFLLSLQCRKGSSPSWLSLLSLL